jgi:hypothetical protein
MLFGGFVSDEEEERGERSVGGVIIFRDYN